MSDNYGVNNDRFDEYEQGTLRQRLGWWLLDAEPEYISHNLDEIERQARKVRDDRDGPYTAHTIKAELDAVRQKLGFEVDQ